MNGRGGVITFFIFLFIFFIILLQVLSMLQSDRFYDGLNRLDEISQSTGAMQGFSRESESRSVLNEESIGDEGDWLVWGLTDEPGKLNPITRRVISSDWIVWRNVFEGLLDYDYNTLEFKPMLAESYEVSEDGLEYTFRLRDDVHFSDGVPITADDVIFTYETINNPGVDAAQLANYYRDVAEVIRIDDRTVKFVMKQPYFKALEFLCFQDVGIIPKHKYSFSDPAEFNRRYSEPFGSGPYVFEKWDVGREVVLRRNENYWGRKPKLRKIVFRFITNDIAAVQALKAGEIDFLEPLPDQFAELSKDEDFKERFNCISYFTPKSPYFYVGWNMNFPLFKDRRIRLAMTYIIDRERIIKYLLKDQAKITTGPFYIYGKQNDPNIAPWPFDPQMAEKLLEEAGWIDRDGDGVRDKDGVPFRFKLMIRSGDPYYEQLAKFIKDEAIKIGVDVIPEPFEWSIFIERLLDREFEAEISGWGGVVEEDPYQVWHSSQGTGRGSNHVGFSNAEADALIEQARRTFDETERNKLYRRFHDIVHYEQPYTFLYARPEMRFLDKRFQNVKIHNLDLDLLEWYVPKEEQRYK